MVTMLDGFRAHLKAKLNASDSYITLTRSDAMKLNAVGLDNHVYLTVRDRVNSEIVKYTHADNWTTADESVVQVPVERNVRGLGAKNFPYGTCVTSEVNSLYISDLVSSLSPEVKVPCEASGDSVLETSSCAIPTTVVGNTTAVMGKPAGYIEFCENKLVPYYDKREA